jgi:hypothetical protein
MIAYYCTKELRCINLAINFLHNSFFFAICLEVLFYVPPAFSGLENEKNTNAYFFSFLLMDKSKSRNSQTFCVFAFAKTAA